MNKQIPVLCALDKRNLDMVFAVDAVKQRHNNALTIESRGFINIISMLNFGIYLLIKHFFITISLF